MFAVNFVRDLRVRLFAAALNHENFYSPAKSVEPANIPQIFICRIPERPVSPKRHSPVLSPTSGLSSLNDPKTRSNSSVKPGKKEAFASLWMETQRMPG
jgi:hypothetical protein